MTFPASIQSAIGAPANMRIGTVAGVADGQTLIMLENTVLDPNAVGFLNGYVPTVGDVVAVSGQSAQPSARVASWLVHGRITAQPATPKPYVLSCQGLPAQSTTSATSVDLLCNPGVVASIEVTKFRDDTGLKCFMSLFARITGAGIAGIQFGLEILGTDFPLALAFFNTLEQHQGFSAVDVIDGIPAGTFTVTARWRRNGGGATLATDSNDTLSFSVEEVPV